MEIPKISIGIPIYNENETIRQTLVSIRNAIKNTNLTYEILPCFNGTTDDGMKIAMEMRKEEPNLRILESQPGRTKAMKKIIDDAKGEIIIFSDADIIVEDDCYINLLEEFRNEEVFAVVGNPIPLKKNNLLYNILNARMMNFGSEVSRRPIQGFTHKPFVHGRTFAIRKKLFINNLLFEERFEDAINDDMFITHLIILQYGRRAIRHEEKAVVRYLPVQSLGLWWQKWVRLWGDLDYIYCQNPEFKKLKPLMKTKINWKFVFNKSALTTLHFILERGLYHSGRLYFNLTKNIYRRERCLRLDETKKKFKTMK